MPELPGEVIRKPLAERHTVVVVHQPDDGGPNSLHELQPAVLQQFEPEGFQLPADRGAEGSAARLRKKRFAQRDRHGLDAAAAERVAHGCDAAVAHHILYVERLGHGVVSSEQN